MVSGKLTRLLIAKFEAYNQETGDKSKTRALSMDVKGLYPAMTRAESKKSIIDMVCNSDVSVENVDYYDKTDRWIVSKLCRRRS